MKKLPFLVILLSVFLLSCQQEKQTVTISEADLAARKKAKKIRNNINKLLPKAMEKANVDAWLVLCRGIDNDPLADQIGGENVVETTAFIFFHDGRAFRSLVLAPQSEVQALRDLRIHDKVMPVREGYPADFAAANFLINKNMERIAINTSYTNPIADGLSYTQRIKLEELFIDQKDKLVSSTELVDAWLAADSSK
jgi:hypothetical protein